MKRNMILLLLGSCVFAQATKNNTSMMGAYITPDGQYSNPTSRLVDNVLLDTTLGQPNKAICLDFQSLKKALQRSLEANPDVTEQFSTITTLKELIVFIESLPEQNRSAIIALINQLHIQAHNFIGSLEQIKKELVYSKAR